MAGILMPIAAVSKSKLVFLCKLQDKVQKAIDEKGITEDDLDGWVN